MDNVYEEQHDLLGLDSCDRSNLVDAVFGHVSLDAYLGVNEI